MRLTETGCREVLHSMQESRALMLRRRDEALRKMGEAENETHQLNRILSATDAVIEAWSEQLAELQGQAG